MLEVKLQDTCIFFFVPGFTLTLVGSTSVCAAITARCAGVGRVVRANAASNACICNAHTVVCHRGIRLLCPNSKLSPSLNCHKVVCRRRICCVRSSSTSILYDAYALLHAGRASVGRRSVVNEKK